MQMLKIFKELNMELLILRMTLKELGFAQDMDLLIFYLKNMWEKDVLLQIWILVHKMLLWELWDIALKY